MRLGKLSYEKHMKLLLWNIEWAEKNSKRGQIITKIISRHGADIVCFTETTLGMLPDGGHIILSGEDFGYSHDGSRRKVAMWSNQPWTLVDCFGDAGLPGGRFVSGVTHGIRFIGVCIPWKDAHVRTGNRNCEPWSEHLSYIACMTPVLQKYCSEPEPVCMLGDYNQRIPQVKQPDAVYAAITELLSGRLICATEGIRTSSGQQFIDHVSGDSQLKITIDTIIPKEQGGVMLSDHDGFLCDVWKCRLMFNC